MNDTPPPSLPRFDPAEMGRVFLRRAHPGWLGLKYSAHGDNWVELELPWNDKLLGEPDRPVLASGPIISLMDMASGMSIWQTHGTFLPVATLDLRVDYQRPARERSAVSARVECYQITRSAAFVRGIAHDGDAEDTVATMAGVFMTLSTDPLQIARILADQAGAFASAGQTVASAAGAGSSEAEPAMIEPVLPAYARSLGIRIHELEGDIPILAVDFDPNVEGRPEHYHGGAIAGLLENAGYCALRERLIADGRDARLKPVNITVQYLSAGKSQASFAKGRVTRMGRRNANVTVEAWQADRDKPIASAVMNILIA